MADRGGLENRCGTCVTVGSNPTLSAMFIKIFGFESHSYRVQAALSAMFIKIFGFESHSYRVQATLTER